MIPQNRAQFKEYILQSLGKGVIRIEVTDQQVDNQVDWALARFQDYHFDGSRETYFKYQVTQDDLTNKYITLPEGTIGAVEIFDITSTLMGQGIWNVQYQWILTNIPNWANLNLTDYWMTMSHLAQIQEVLVGKQPIRYNRYENNKMYIDMDWQRVNVGDYLVVRLYQVMDPETYPKIWSDQWLIRYTTELVKKQWGSNLKKYSGIPLPNNNTLNGQQIYDEAVAALKDLDDELISSYSIPVMNMIA